LDRWADYLISAVEYDKDHKIVKAKQHQDKFGEISPGEIIPREIIASNIKNGKRYMTIHSGLNDIWTIGQKITTHRVSEDYCIRIDDNKVKQDNLGNLVELE